MADYDHAAITWNVISKDQSDPFWTDEADFPSMNPELVPALAVAMQLGSGGSDDGTGFGYGFPGS